MVDFVETVEAVGGVTGLCIVDVADSAQNKDGHLIGCPKSDTVGIEGENLEQHDGIDFESHEAAYIFYQEYAKSMGFTTSIKNSRRSKKTKEFIDAKFACSRYGVTPESESGSSRRPSVKKTGCKASMHVKRKRDGKWYIHEFMKEHNHELLPALAYHFRIHRNVKLADKNNIDILHAVSERTRKMYVEMSRQYGGGHNYCLDKNEFDHQFDRDQYLALEEGDAQVILEYFVRIQKENPSFFYAIDLNEDQRLRNLFWVDGKSRKDYIYFNDVVCFDTSYMKINEKMPIVLFIGVNHHFQPMLLGSALLADETKPTFVWLMKSWVKAMGGQAPKVVITDQDNHLRSAIEEVFPYTRHCFALWNILERMAETLAHALKYHDNLMKKFNKCIFKSLTDEEFDMRWWKMIGRFELHNNEWILSLYADRKMWVPAFLKECFLAGLYTSQRSESMNSFFDRYIHKKINLKDFVRQYGTMLQSRYEEEDMADFDTWHKQPALKSPSPWEKQMSTIYTHAIFRKFQVEVLGVVGCHPKKEKENGGISTFRVDDCEKVEHFMVTWNEANSEVSCSCMMFENRGFLCRHSMIVLQICGLSIIPSRYILKRWTKDAKTRQAVIEGTERIQNRVQRYNDLCKRAIELGEEGSLSEDNYNIACRTLIEALKDCVDINNRNAMELSSSSVALHREEENQFVHSTKANKKKTTNKRRKLQIDKTAVVEAQDHLQQVENLCSDGMSLNGFYGSQHNVHGLLNLMEPPQDAYYVGQQTMQGMGQLNPIASGHDGFYGVQQSMPGLGHLDFRQQSFSYGMQDEHNQVPLRLKEREESGDREISIEGFLSSLAPFSLQIPVARCRFEGLEGGGFIGVNYGRIANDLPSATKVVQLLRSQGLDRVKVYDTDPAVLKALSGSGIRVTVSLPNELLSSAARRQSFASWWVLRNVAAYHPSTVIEAIAVGNEVFVDTQNTTRYLIPALYNIHDALVKYNLHENIKLSSPIALSALQNSYPSSAGTFRPDLIELVFKPMLEFLRKTGSKLMVNVYPFFAYESNANVIPLDYALSRENPGVVDAGNGLHYYTLFDAQIDAVFAAMSALKYDDVGIIVSETGWPSKGDSNEHGASVENAASYNGNLVHRVLTGGGTPVRPNENLTVFLFALFNENKKVGPTSERNFGLFYPDEKKVYEVPFTPEDLKNYKDVRPPRTGGEQRVSTASGETWCVAKMDAGKDKLQQGLDYACGEGAADCHPIQPGSTCFDPNTLEAHASYAFNSYYQKKGRGMGTCYFGGASYISTQHPKYGKCELPTGY